MIREGHFTTLSLLATVAFAASLAPDQVRVELPDLERARQPVTVPFIDPQMVSIGKDKLGVTTFFEMFNRLREAGLLKTELGTSAQNSFVGSIYTYKQRCIFWSQSTRPTRRLTIGRPQ